MWMWLLILALAVIGSWLYFKPVWAPKPDKVQAQVEKNLRVAANQAGKMYAGVSGKLKLRRDTQGLANQYKQWVATSSLHQSHWYADWPGAAENFSAWLAGLSPKETTVFCDKVAHFCASLGFDLAWLVDDQLNGQPELKRAVEEAVALYSVTAWRASQVEAEVRAFMAYQQWLAHPNKQRALGQKLYGELIQKGLVTPTPDLYLAPEKERVAAAARAIKQIAADKPDAFTAVLRGIINPAPVAATTPAPSEA